jgi:translation initiation factor IF-3
MQVVGIIKRVQGTKEVSATFKAREVHVATEEQFSQTLNIQFVNEKVSLLDNYKEGDKVKIDINLRGRESVKDGETKVFNTIQGWKIEKAV